MEENTSFTIAALIESNDLLRDTVARHRRTITMLRKVNRRLRVIQSIAHANDAEFRESLELNEREEEQGGECSPKSSE